MWGRMTQAQEVVTVAVGLLVVSVASFLYCWKRMSSTDRYDPDAPMAVVLGWIIHISAGAFFFALLLLLLAGVMSGLLK
jgi:hypothetical protein